MKKNKKLKKNYLQKIINGQVGQASRLLLVLAVVVLVAVLIVFLVMKMATPAPEPESESAEQSVPQSVYEEILGVIKFTFQSSINMGNRLRASSANSKQFNLKDRVTTERYIMVTVGAQNKGKYSTAKKAWDIGNIVDSDGRIFSALSSYDMRAWIPSSSNCGALLKPEFEPIPCTKIYEVSKVSKSLKIEIITGKENSPISSSGNIVRLLDLIVK